MSNQDPVPNLSRSFSPLKRWGVIGAGIVIVALIAFISLNQRQPASRSAGPVTIPNFSDTKSFSKDYSKLPASSAVVISSFEGDEQWEGEGVFDATTRFEGQSSLLLRSVQGRSASAVLRGNFDFSKVKLFELAVTAQELKDIASLVVRFGDPELDSVYEFPAGVLAPGWNVLPMSMTQFIARSGNPAPSWDSIKAVQLELTGRPGTEVKANFDLLRAEAGDMDFKADWVTNGEQVLGLMPSKQGPSLLVRNVGGSIATIAKVADAKNFTVQAAISPLTQGRGGLLLRGNSGSGTGYSYVIGGLLTSTWQIIRTDEKGSTVLEEGTLRNLGFRRDESYWLRARVRGSDFELALSRNGRTYSPLANLRDETFSFGEVGFTALDGGAFLVHEIDYQKSD